MDAFAVHALKSQLAVFGDTDHMRSRRCPVGPRFSHELKLYLIESEANSQEQELSESSTPQSFMAQSPEGWYPKSDAGV
jgi:hypothetical protein